MSTRFLSQTIRKLSVGLWLVAISTAPAPAIEAWVQRYDNAMDDFAISMATDNAGNVVVTGASTGASSDDYATVKYSGAGVPLWTNRYHGPGTGADQANAVAVDGNGNVFVTGYSSGSGGSLDYATIKYSAAGVPLWTNRYNGPGNDTDEAYFLLVVDGGGGVCVTGDSIGSEGTLDYATIKYSSAGMPLWTNRYNGPSNRADYAYALAVDANSNVVVTGRSNGGGSLDDYATIKYSGAGMPLWTNRYNGPGNSTDEPSEVAVDADGNVLVTGFSFDGGFDYATIKYSSAGMPLWTNRYNGPGNNNDEAYSVAVDSTGNVFVTGSSGGSFSSEGEFVTIKYSSSGVPLWTNHYNGPGTGTDAAYFIKVDGSGNVIVAGDSVGDDGGFDYATVAYTGAGVPLWTNRYNGPANGEESLYGLAVDGSGNVFVTGWSYNGTDFDYATIKYSVAALAPIPLNYQIVGNAMVLSWTNAAFSLQAAPDVQGSYTNIPGATSPHATSLSGRQRYFRLIGN